MLKEAELIAEKSADDRDTAATRVWAAGECLKKAGASDDTPLVFRHATEDDWVLFEAGSLSIATCVAPVRDVKGKLALAVLIGDKLPDGGQPSL